jgi:hypothetical protein
MWNSSRVDLKAVIQPALGDKAQFITVAMGEVTLWVVVPRITTAAMQTLDDAPSCKFEQLIDLCGLTIQLTVTLALRGRVLAWFRICCPLA